MYIDIVHTHMHTVQDFQLNFYNRTVLLFLLQFCIPGKRKVTENLDEVVWRSYISSHVQFQH